MNNIDPINLEIYWARAIAIANEMMETLIRTSFSTVIRINRDCSAAIFDHQGRMLAQPDHSAPGHIGCMPGVMRRILKEFATASIESGDVFITNDPWIGAGHSPDIYIASPIFYRDKLAGFACTVAHHIDIGGRVGPTDSQDVYEEGILIPPMRLYRAGERNEDLFRMIEMNVRLPHVILGDIDAQMASNRLGSERLIEFGEDYDLDGFDHIARAITSSTERAIRARIRDLPDGVWTTQQELELMDENGKKITVHLKVEIKGDSIIFDYEGTSPQVRRPINCVLNYAMSYTVLGLKMLLAPELPYNEGTQIPVTVIAPAGSVLNPRWPAAVWRLKTISAIIKKAKTILWNGPVGAFETKQFSEGTEAVAHAVAASAGYSVAGGGDTLAAIEAYNVADKIDYISTGGGAFLSFLEGKTLPAIAALEERTKNEKVT